VLMSSGYAETGTLRKGGEALIAGFVQKPYTTTQIIDRLRRIIDSTATPKSAPAGISAAAVNSTAADS
jgi:hypothetical protein